MDKNEEMPSEGREALMDSQKERMKKSRGFLFDGIKKNEESFENKITYIGAGSIMLSMGFLAAKESLICNWIFYVGMLFQTSSLFANLSLYVWSNWLARKEIKKIDNCFGEKKYRDSNPQIASISNRINGRNVVILILLGAGIIATMIFVFINTRNDMGNEEMPHTPIYEEVHIENSFTFEYDHPQIDESVSQGGGDQQSSPGE